MHLAKINVHPRDKDIQFFEEGHIYIIYFQNCKVHIRKATISLISWSNIGTGISS